MIRISWLRRLKQIWLGKFKRTPLHKGKKKSQRLLLEILEDRLTPAANLVSDINPLVNAAGSSPGNFVDVNGVAFFTAAYGIDGALWKSDGTEAGTVLVKDLNSVSHLTNVNGTLFFTAFDNVNGFALWKSDGMAAGTVVLKGQFSPTAPRYLTNMNGTLFFSTNDAGAHGYELWKSDGTAAGTVMVKDIFAGSSSSSPKFLTNVNGTLYFQANDGVNGKELWKSDGTAAGTVLVKDIRSGSADSLPRYLTDVNGTLFFNASEGVNGYELWKSDGTAAGTMLVKDIASGSTASFPQSMTNVNGTLFFTASDVVIGNDRELWKSDGTAAGTVLVKDISPGSTGSNPFSLTNVNGTLFFDANDGVNGVELWTSDGTAAGTVLVKDIWSGSAGSIPLYLTNVNGTLFFNASDAVNGGELWKSDGTAAGTVLVKDILPGSSGSSAQFLTNVNGTLFFSANDGVYGKQLWTSDGTAAGTVMVKAIRVLPLSSGPNSLTNLNGALYFSANDGVHGYELCKSDGTTAGTAMVKDINSGSGNSSPFHLTNINGTLFFQANDGVHGIELWKSDGTVTGTVQVKDIRSGSSDSNPSYLTNLNGTLFFTASDGVTAGGLWKSDGTATGTVLVSTSVSKVHYLTNVNGTLFFLGWDAVNDYELWKSDGTAAGTVLVKDIHPGSSASRPYNLTNVNGTLFFSATDGANGYELWKSDGTAAGTVLVKDIRPGSSGSRPRYLTNVNGTLFFRATDGVKGYELWKSDGTSAGTVLVKDIFAGSSNSNPRNLTNLNGTLYFQANDGVNGTELWKSDGTTAGTVLVKDIFSGSSGSNPKYLTNVNGTLYFQANDGVNGAELWKSDGTAAGTVLVSDIMAASGSSSPAQFQSVGNTLYFSAADATHGYELWSLVTTNNAPAGTNNTVTTLEDTAYTLATGDFGFSDPNDSPANNFSTVEITTLSALGTLKDNGLAVTAGQFIPVSDINAGLLVYTPAANANGAAYANFTFQVQDDGGTANGGIDTDQTANTMALSVTSVNDAPHGTSNTVTTNEDIAYTFAAADFGFTDPSDSPANNFLAVEITTLPALGTLKDNGVAVTAGQFVSVAHINSGLLVFTPATLGFGALYTSFTFQVQDDGGIANGGQVTAASPNTLTINVNMNLSDPNNAPAGTDNSVTILEDNSCTFATDDFGFGDPNDSPPNALLAVKISTLPGAGTLSDNGVAVTASQLISVADINAGKLVFTPAANANGAAYANFTFRVQDDGGSANGGIDTDPSAKSMTISVTSVNDAPHGTNNPVTTSEDTAYTFATSDFGYADPNDSPPNNFLNLIVQTLPGAGALTDNGVAVTAGQYVSVADINAVLLVFTPAANANGSPYTSFSFEVQDDGGTANGMDTDPPVTMTMDLASINDPPAGTNNTVTTLEDSAYTFATGNFGFTDPLDSPANAFQAVEITTVPGAGTLADNGVAVTTGQFVSVADINAGLLVFTPAANANGTAYASFTFQVQDDGGGTNTNVSPNTMTVNVTSVNDAPAGTNNTRTMTANTNMTFSTTDFGFSDSNDSPANAFQAIEITTLPGLATLKDNGVAVTAGQFVSVTDINAGMLVYTPAANGHGGPYSSFTFQVQDNGGTANSGVDADQSANTMTFNVQLLITLNSAVLNSDYAPIVGASLSSGTVTISTDGAHGFTAGNVVVVAGYTGANAGYNGTYTIASTTAKTFTYLDSNTGMGTLTFNNAGFAISKSSGSSLLQPGFGPNHQRSMVDSVAYTFNQVVNNPSTAISLGLKAGASGTFATMATAVANSNWTSLDGGQIWVLTFSSATGTTVTGHAIEDGVYTLSLTPGNVTSSDGANTVMTNTRTQDVFYRLFGDFNGDRRVENTDNAKFAGTLGLSYQSTTPGYQGYHDFNGDGRTNNTDTAFYSDHARSNWSNATFAPTI